MEERCLVHCARVQILDGDSTIDSEDAGTSHVEIGRGTRDSASGRTKNLDNVRLARAGRSDNQRRPRPVRPAVDKSDGRGVRRADEKIGPAHRRAVGERQGYLAGIPAHGSGGRSVPR